MYGFSGSSRSGKTTLAKSFAESFIVPYVDSSTTVLMRKAGFNPVAALNIIDRITAQEALLKGYKALIAESPSVFVTDRTPIDMMAYMLAEVNMHNTNIDLGKRIDDYCAECLETAQRMFSIIFLVNPLGMYEAQDDKPPPSAAYQSHIHMLIHSGLVSSDVAYIKVPTGTVVERMVALTQTVANYTAQVMNQNQGRVLH